MEKYNFGWKLGPKREGGDLSFSSFFGSVLKSVLLKMCKRPRPSFKIQLLGDFRRVFTSIRIRIVFFLKLANRPIPPSILAFGFACFRCFFTFLRALATPMGTFFLEGLQMNSPGLQNDSPEARKWLFQGSKMYIKARTDNGVSSQATTPQSYSAECKYNRNSMPHDNASLIAQRS